MLEDIDNTISGSVEIGKTHKGQPINVYFLGVSTALFKIFVLAGQHGDEKCSRDVAVHFVNSIQKSFNFYLSNMQIAVLPDANPDGASENTRENAIKIDINRDHQSIESNENFYIHSFIQDWKPHLIIDLHNYPPRRKHLLKDNLVYKHDVFIDVPNNPAVKHQLDQDSVNDYLKYINDYLDSQGFFSKRYTMVTPSGRVRHGTPDIVDARNGLSLKFNTFTVLIEGKAATRFDGEKEKRRSFESLYQSLLGAIRWAEGNKEFFIKNEGFLPSVGDKVPVHYKYRRSQNPLVMDFKNSESRDIESVTFEKYTPTLETTKYITLPKAYAVPYKKIEIVKTLKKHGFSSQFPDDEMPVDVEKFFIKSVKHSKRERRPPRKIDFDLIVEKKALDKFLIFPTDQKGGEALAVFLEPESKYGLHRFGKMGLEIKENSNYPVLRVI